jgi:hypothetical protein
MKDFSTAIAVDLISCSQRLAISNKEPISVNSFGRFLGPFEMVDITWHWHENQAKIVSKTDRKILLRSGSNVGLYA